MNRLPQLTFAALLLAASARAQVEAVFVPGTANLFAAGRSTLPAITSPGTLPIEVNLPPSATFIDVFGTVSCCGGPPFLTGPEGDTSCCSTDLDSLGGISGIRVGGRAQFLAGVFIGDTEPVAPAPARLDFTGNLDFGVLAPELGQTFFIGDGRSSTGPQTFSPPPGATRLFLGVLDGFSFQGTPGFFDDNAGGFVVQLGAQPLGSSYCECVPGVAPCGNDGPYGCLNSAGLSARLTATGTASVSADDLILVTQSTPGGSFGLLAMGGSPSQGALGNGVLCVGTGGFGLRRFPVVASDRTGTLLLGPGIAALNQAIHPPAAHLAAGVTAYFQTWYRDSPGPCGAGSNLSNAISITFAP